MKSPRLPIKKSKDDINFYLKYGKDFGEVLWDFREYFLSKYKYNNILHYPSIDFQHLCNNKYGNNFTVSYPFGKQKNYLGKEFINNICISTNSTIAHGVQHYTLKQDDIISVDCGIELNRLYDPNLNFDAAFTLCPEDTKDNWELAPLEALKNIVKEQPKDTMEIAEVIQATAQQYNLQQVVSLTGHGIGYSLHEEPIIHNAPGPFSPIKLFDGLVFCAEPIFVKPTKENNSSPIAHTCLGSDGWEVLTISGDPATHWETMFAVINGQIVDLTGITEWNL